jgi:hypothetical protein
MAEAVAIYGSDNSLLVDTADIASLEWLIAPSRFRQALGNHHLKVIGDATAANVDDLVRHCGVALDALLCQQLRDKGASLWWIERHDAKSLEVTEYGFGPK